jgi:hypothetical protein
MYNIIVSLGLIIILIISGVLIGTFFDVKPEYYIPFLIWGIVLCIFNMMLDKETKNIYMNS